MQLAELIELKALEDERGYLLPLEADGAEVPFPVKRVYFMYGMPDDKERGKHAHRDTRQLLVCVHGAVTIDCDFGRGLPIRHFRLDSPTKGLLLGGLVWREMRDFSPGTVIAVLADEHYSEAAPKEIRNYEEFLSHAREEA